MTEKIDTLPPMSEVTKRKRTSQKVSEKLNHNVPWRTILEPL